MQGTAIPTSSYDTYYVLALYWVNLSNQCISSLFARFASTRANHAFCPTNKSSNSNLKPTKKSSNLMAEQSQIKTCTQTPIEDLGCWESCLARTRCSVEVKNLDKYHLLCY